MEEQRQGLLGRIGSGVQKAVNSPVGTGLLGAAVLGVNPLAGLLLAPAIKSDREATRLALESEREKLEEFRQGRKQRDTAQQGFEGLLGRLTEPRTVEGPLPAGQQGPGLPVQAPGLLSNEQADLLRAQNTLDPAAATQTLGGLLFQKPDSPRTPADLATMQALGIPLTEEGFARFSRIKGQQDPNTQLLAQQRQLEIDKLLEEAKDRQQNKQVTRAQREAAVNKTLRSARTLAGLNDRLEGTFQETGLPFADARRLGASGFAAAARALGKDTTEIERSITDIEFFNKLIEDFGIDLLSRFEGTGTVSNAKLGQLRASLGGVGVSPGANRLVLSGFIDTALEAAEIEGFELSEEEKKEFRQLSARLAEGKPGGPSKPAAGEPRVLQFNPATGRVE